MRPRHQLRQVEITDGNNKGTVGYAHEIFHHSNSNLSVNPYMIIEKENGELIKASIDRVRFIDSGSAFGEQSDFGTNGGFIGTGGFGETMIRGDDKES